MVCPSCNNISEGLVCKHCGENLWPKRITFFSILKDIPDVFFDVDRGLFYTIRTFLLRPGKEIRKYFAGDRIRHYKPLKFVLFIGGFAAFLYAKFQFNNGEPQPVILQFGNNWTSLIMLVQFPILALFTWLIFHKRKYTYGEHLIGNAYIIGEVLLFKIALFPMFYYFNGSPSFDYAEGLYLLSIIFYYSFAYYDWFYQRKGSEGLIVSIVFVFLLFIVIQVFTYLLQVILYYSFLKLGWI